MYKHHQEEQIDVMNECKHTLFDLCNEILRTGLVIQIMSKELVSTQIRIIMAHE